MIYTKIHLRKIQHLFGGSSIRRIYTREFPSQMNNLMDIGSRSIFNKDHDIFRESVRRFMKDKLEPLQNEFEINGMPSKDIWKLLGNQGYIGTSIPTNLYGVGGSFKDETIVLEEQTYAQAWSPALFVHSGICLPYLAKYGTNEQKDKYLPDLMTGNKVCAIGITEPSAGSDIQGIKTFATKDGDDFIVNGSKVYISNGILADVFLLAVITNKEAKSIAHGMSLIIVESSMKGFNKGKNLKKLGMKAVDTAELFFDNVRVPKENILGGENKGFYRMMTELPQERLGIAIISAANCEWMFEKTREFLKIREAFGSTLSDLQVIRHRMAEMKTQICVLRSFIDECIDLHDRKQLKGESASMAKYYSTDLENKIAAECLQLHGGMGYMWETPITKAFANARVQTIYGGSNEIMKELIARQIF